MLEISSAIFLLFGGIASALLTWNASRPFFLRSSPLAAASFVSGWLTTELALHHVFVQGVFVVICVAFGALEKGTGIVGMVLFVASWIGLLRIHGQAKHAEQAIENLFTKNFPEAPPMETKPVRLRYLAMPFAYKHADVERTMGLEYQKVNGIPLKLDVYRRHDLKGPAPVLLFIHGGAWVMGYREYQSIPLLTRMALRGWLCFSADYRLSPRATFPDHIHDVKRAIAWARENAHTFGGDPNYIAISGNSAGGHLSSLAALTWDRKDLQPGFENADTRVQACVSFYGVYDFLNRQNQWPHRGLQDYLERYVIKKTIDEGRDLYSLASPIDHVRVDAPPFLLIHGDRDTLVPVRDAQLFAEALGSVSRQLVVYAEIPGAQHAFDMFRSLRSQYAIRAASRFLEAVHARARVAEPKTVEVVNL